jgi:hypothetical protein
MTGPAHRLGEVVSTASFVRTGYGELVSCGFEPSLCPRENTDRRK